MKKDSKVFAAKATYRKTQPSRGSQSPNKTYAGKKKK